MEKKIRTSKEQKEMANNLESTQTIQGLISGSGDLLTDIAVAVLIELIKKGRQTKYTLCEEGIVLYKWLSANLYPCRKIYKLKANPEVKQFEFNLRGIVGKLSILAPKNFDEVKIVLSVYIELA